MIGLPPNTGIYILASDTRQLTRAEVAEINELPHGLMLVNNKHRDSYKNVKVLINNGNVKQQAIDFYKSNNIRITGLVKIDLIGENNTSPPPTRFDAEYYMKKNPDVVSGGFNTPELAKRHYKLYGKAEGRQPFEPPPACDPFIPTPVSAKPGPVSKVKNVYDTKKYFIIEPKNGLGNRLRALGSAYSISNALGMELLVLWLPDMHCKAKWKDIFETNNIHNVRKNKNQKNSLKKHDINI